VDPCFESEFLKLATITIITEGLELFLANMQRKKTNTATGYMMRAELF
jgi:hypothetical protein